MAGEWSGILLYYTGEKAKGNKTKQTTTTEKKKNNTQIQLTKQPNNPLSTIRSEQREKAHHGFCTAFCTAQVI